MINYKLLGSFIGQECIKHPVLGRYILDGFYSKGVMATRNLSGLPEDEEYEMFSFDEITFLESVISNQNVFIERKYSEIEQAVCGLTGLTPIELREGKGKKRELVEARQLCHFICKKKNLGMLQRIGTRFGGKKYTTVVHSVKTVSTFIETDKDFSEKYKPILDQFYYGKVG